MSCCESRPDHGPMAMGTKIRIVGWVNEEVVWSEYKCNSPNLVTLCTFQCDHTSTVSTYITLSLLNKTRPIWVFTLGWKPTHYCRILIVWRIIMSRRDKGSLLCEECLKIVKHCETITNCMNIRQHTWTIHVHNTRWHGVLFSILSIHFD